MSPTALALKQVILLRGVLGTYRQGDTEIPLRAVVTSPRPKVETQREVTLSSSRLELLLLSVDFTVDGTPLTPQVGDRWSAEIGGQAVTFDVTEDESERCFRWADPSERTALRIFIAE